MIDENKTQNEPKEVPAEVKAVEVVVEKPVVEPVVENPKIEEVIVEEKPISAKPKEGVIEDVSVVEDLEVEKTEKISEPEIAEEVVEEKVDENLDSVVKQEKEEIFEDKKVGLPRSAEPMPEADRLAETTRKEISQTETLPTTPIQEVESASAEISKVEPEKPISFVAETVEDKQAQEAPARVETKTVEKIVYKTNLNFIQKLLIKARAKIQERKKKKLDKILSLFETSSQITNSDIQKLLRVSRATAKRYMDILEKENKATQVGDTGKGVFYSKKQ